MAHPKRKTSKTRRDKRRTHYKASKPTVVSCSNCGSPVLYHRVCSTCGYYKGIQVIETNEDIV
ncbi:MAG: 50S ribosomal protein L32 [Bacteroidales bacterium]